MKKVAMIMAVALAGMLVLLLVLWSVIGYMSVKDIETPAYEVEKQASGYEIRIYAPRLQAEVNLAGGYRDSLYSGFRLLANYIFGNNTKQSDIAMTAPVLSEKSEKIAMTAPVLHARQDDQEAYVVAFVLPSAYTLESLPKPNNPEVRIREIPETRYAVYRFRGYATAGRVDKMTARLLKALERDGLKPAGAIAAAQYNPPWTPPFMRRNEIMAPL